MSDTCRRELDDGTACGGRLSTAIRGSHTGRWFRTCTRCLTTYGSDECPPEISDQPLPAFRVVDGLPLTWQERLEAREDER